MAQEEVLIGVKVDTKQAQKSLAQLEKEQEQYTKKVSNLEKALYLERKSLLNATTKEDKEASEKRIKHLEATKKEISKVSAAAGNEIKKLNETMDETTSGFSDGIADIGDSFGSLGAPLAAARGGVAALGKGFKALLANPVVLVVAAIVAGLTALYKAFTRSEDGANKMAVAFAYLEGLLIPLIKGAEALANGLYDLFTEPQKAMEDFANSFKSFVLDKFNLLVESIGLLGSSIKKLFEGDFSGALEDAGKGFVGLNRAINPTVIVMEALVNTTVEYTKEALKMAEANAALERQEQKLVQLNRENEVLLSKQLKDREFLMNIRDNELLSIEERIKANEDLNKLETEQLNRSKEAALLAISIAEQRIVLDGKTTENLDALAEAQVEYNNVLADSAGRQNEYIMNRQGLQREEAELARLSIDFELEKVNITEKSEEKKLKARIKALDDTAKLYGKDTAEYKDFTKQKELAELELSQYKKDLAEEDAKFYEELSKKQKEKEEEQKAATLETAKEEAINLANEVSNAVFEAQAANLEREKEQKLNVVQQTQNRELEIVNARLEKGLINDEQAEQQRQKIEEDSARKSEQIQKEAFKKKQKQDIAAVALDLARQISAIQLNASLNPANAVTFGAAGISQAAILTAGAVATSALQVATIKSQKFEKGGIIEGNSHADGGVPFTVDGVGGFEAEGGEVIINKRSAAMFRKELSVINQAGGGVKFANGGVVGSDSGAASSDITNQLQELIEVSKRPTRAVVSETEITNSQSRISNIEARSSF